MSLPEKAPNPEKKSPIEMPVDEAAAFAAELKKDHQREADAFFKERTSLRSLAENQGNFRLEALDTQTDLPFTKAAYRNYQSFKQLTQQTEEELSRSLKENNGLFTLLYPGGGSHFAPLETAFSILDRDDAKEAVLIYTDIDADAYNTMEKNLAALVQKGILKNSSTKPQTTELEKGSEKQLSYVYESKSGPKEITFKYAIDASDTAKGDHAYYRQKYFDKADLVISHDSSSEVAQDLYFLKSFLTSAVNGTGKNKVFFFEESMGNTIMPDLLPGKVIRTEMPFGCAEDKPGNENHHDHLGKAEDYAAAYIPDIAFYKALTPEELEAFCLFIFSVNSTIPLNPGDPERTISAYTKNVLAKIVGPLFAIAQKSKDTNPEVSTGIAEFLNTFIYRMQRVYPGNLDESIAAWLELIPKNKQHEVLAYFVESDHPLNAQHLAYLEFSHKKEGQYVSTDENLFFVFTHTILEKTGETTLLKIYTDKTFSFLEKEENRNLLISQIHAYEEKRAEWLPKLLALDEVYKEKYGRIVERDEKQYWTSTKVIEGFSDIQEPKEWLATWHEADNEVRMATRKRERIIEYLVLAEKYGKPEVKAAAQNILISL